MDALGIGLYPLPINLGGIPRPSPTLTEDTIAIPHLAQGTSQLEMCTLEQIIDFGTVLREGDIFLLRARPKSCSD